MATRCVYRARYFKTTCAAPNGDFTSTTQSAAVFGQIEYAFSDQWRLTAGLRYTDEEKTMDFFGWVGAPGDWWEPNPDGHLMREANGISVNAIFATFARQLQAWS